MVIKYHFVKIFMMISSLVSFLLYVMLYPHMVKCDRAVFALLSINKT